MQELRLSERLSGDMSGALVGEICRLARLRDSPVAWLAAHCNGEDGVNALS